jgi:hypothetical protein
MKANPETAETVKKRLAEERARAEKEAPTPEGTSYERGRDFVLKVFLAGFALAVAGDIREQRAAAAREEEIQKIIAESRGTKVRCPNPKCTRGRIFWKTLERVRWDPLPGSRDLNPHYTMETIWHNEKCDRCDNKGWVDK